MAWTDKARAASAASRRARAGVKKPSLARTRLYAKSGRDLPNGKNQKRWTNRKIRGMLGTTQSDLNRLHTKRMRTKTGRAESKRTVNASTSAMNLARKSSGKISRGERITVKAQGVPGGYMSPRIRLNGTTDKSVWGQRKNLGEHVTTIKKVRRGINESYWAPGGPGADTNTVVSRAYDAGDSHGVKVARKQAIKARLDKPVTGKRAGNAVSELGDAANPIKTKIGYPKPDRKPKVAKAAKGYTISRGINAGKTASRIGKKYSRG